MNKLMINITLNISILAGYWIGLNTKEVPPPEPEEEWILVEK